MTNKEEKEYKKELLTLLIEKFIGGSISKLNNKNKKLYKDTVKERDVNVSIYCLRYIKSQFYSWEVEENDYELNPCFDRMIYLFNSNYEVCEVLVNSISESEVIEKDYDINLKSNNDIRSYLDKAMEVGL